MPLWATQGTEVLCNDVVSVGTGVTVRAALMIKNFVVKGIIP
jgi:hypothetical protein